jgi:hypothetical protein
MELFLVVAAAVLFIAGSLLLLSPKTIENMSKVMNKALFSLDEKIPVLRRPLGIFFLAITIYLWYILLYKIYK